MNDNQSQTKPGGPEHNKPAATPEQPKPSVVTPAQAPSQQPGSERLVMCGEGEAGIVC